MGWVTDAGGGLSGCGKCMEMENLDVSSARCNTLLQKNALCRPFDFKISRSILNFT